MIVVSDTSPISNLIDIGLDRLLVEMYGEVIVPHAVHDELRKVHPNLPKFLRVEKIQDERAVGRLKAELDLGEAEAVVLAKELHADVLLMDEQEGRRVAVREGLRVVGLLGVLIEARQEKKIGPLKPVLERLQSVAGFWMTDKLKTEVLESVGEG